MELQDMNKNRCKAIGKKIPSVQAETLPEHTTWPAHKKLSIAAHGPHCSQPVNKCPITLILDAWSWILGNSGFSTLGKLASIFLPVVRTMEDTSIKRVITRSYSVHKWLLQDEEGTDFTKQNYYVN